MTAFSPVESFRFGHRVGRLDALDDAAESAALAVAEDELDVLIVRCNADDVTLAARLSAIDGYRTIHADTLMYWECALPTNLPPTAGGGLTSLADDRLEPLVRATFARYQNHYVANPLFSAKDILDGYCEWAQTVADQSGPALALVGEEGIELGFVLVDWAQRTPDIRLAGMVEEARGLGLYRSMLGDVMRHAHGLGHVALHISTQAHNVRVMRVWSGLGWKPFACSVTYHLVRNALLDKFVRESPRR